MKGSKKSFFSRNSEFGKNFSRGKKWLGKDISIKVANWCKKNYFTQILFSAKPILR